MRRLGSGTWDLIVDVVTIGWLTVFVADLLRPLGGVALVEHDGNVVSLPWSLTTNLLKAITSPLWSQRLCLCEYSYEVLERDRAVHVLAVQ